MSNTIVELKKLDIDKVVDWMKLSDLANHIVKSLHEMTTGKSHVRSGKCSAGNMRLDPTTTSLILSTLCSAWRACPTAHSPLTLWSRASGTDDI
jgi:hypothetical protein